MKKILKLLQYCPQATRKMVILMLLYTAQAVFQVMQPEVLNRSVQAIENRNAGYLGQAMMLAAVALAGNLIVDVFIKLRQRKFLNDTLLSVQTDLLTRVINFKRLHFLKTDPSGYLTGIVNFAEGAVESSVNWFTKSVFNV